MTITDAGAAAAVGPAVLRQPKRRRTLRRRTILLGWATVLPAVAVLAVLIWYPVISTVQHSFTDWNGFSENWVGFDNYVVLFETGEFFELFRTNLIFLASIPLLFVIVVAVSVLIHDRIPGWRVFRSVYYIPTVLSAAVVGLLAGIMFAPRGAINTFLGSVGLDFLARDWFGNTTSAFAVLILVFFWQSLGQGVLVFLAGLSTVPQEMIEAAQMDGAGWWRRLFSVILPQLSPTSAYFLLTNIIYVMVDLFALVFVTTRGGPGRTTTPVDYMIYVKAFEQGQLGAASALAVILLIIVFTCAYFQLRLADRSNR